MVTTVCTNNRRSERIPANAQVTLVLESQRRQTQIGQRVSTVDACPLGVRIRSFGALVRGQTVSLIPREDSSKCYPCRMGWVSPLSPRLSSQAGLEFWAAAKPIARSQLN